MFSSLKQMFQNLFHRNNIKAHDLEENYNNVVHDHYVDEKNTHDNSYESAIIRRRAKKLVTEPVENGGDDDGSIFASLATTSMLVGNSKNVSEDTPSFSGDGGTFGGAGASGDWDSKSDAPSSIDFNAPSESLSCDNSSSSDSSSSDSFSSDSSSSDSCSSSDSSSSDS